VRAGSGRSEDGITGVVLRARRDRGPFDEVTEVGVSQQTDFEFAGFAVDPKTIYLTAIGASGRKELFSYDLAAQPARQDALRRRRTTTSGAGRVAARRRAVGGRGRRGQARAALLRPAAQREQASIDAAFPGTTNRIVSIDRAGTTAIVRTSGDTNPPDYYRYDRDASGMDYLFTANPALDRGQLVRDEAGPLCRARRSRDLRLSHRAARLPGKNCP
jgi:hypothetical protein